MTANQNTPSDPLLQKAAGRNQFIGDWEVLDYVGKGGFGKAYQVVKNIQVGQSTVRIPAVLKIVRSDAPNSFVAKQMLVNEIEKLSRVNSRFVANLRDAGFYQDGMSESPYLVADFIEGGNLRSLIQERRAKHRSGLSASQFKTLAENTLRGLYSAHAAKCWHLDIKPDNIIYSQSDDAFVIIDFGLAVLSHRDTIDTFVGGTPGYIAPEAYISQTSMKSDIYALGITFYEAAIGVNPIYRAYEEYLYDNDPGAVNVYRAGQIALETTSIDLDLLSPDKRQLIDPMLKHDPKQRPSLELLIALAGKLSSGAASGEPDQAALHTLKPNWPDDILKLVTNQPIDSVKVTVDHENHFQVWFKSKRIDDELVLICSKPKNYLALGDIGWRPYQPGTLIFRFEAKPTVQVLSKTIVGSISKGFGISMPFTIT